MDVKYYIFPWLLASIFMVIPLQAIDYKSDEGAELEFLLNNKTMIRS